MANLTDPAFRRFLDHAQHTDPKILNLALRDGLVAGKWQLNQNDGTPVDPSTLKLDTLRATLPQGELTEDSTVEIYVEAKDGTQIRTTVSSDSNPPAGPLGELEQEIVQILSRLDRREADILALRFGLDKGEPREAEEVGEIFDLPASRIRQIEQRALQKLSHDEHEKLAAAAASIKVREELADTIRAVDALPVGEQADLLIDIVANAIQKGRAEHQAIRAAIVAERDEEFWGLIFDEALDRLGVDDPGELLTGRELKEFERDWDSGLYQRRIKQMVRTGEFKLVDTETNEPADIDPDTLTFERQGQRVLIRADGRKLRVGEMKDNMKESALVRKALTGPPGMRGYLWMGQIPPPPRRCPRCGVTMIPTDEHPGEYPGAMSRVRVGGAREGYATRSVEICSPCGQDEAMGRGIVPIEEWPLGTDGISFYDRAERERIRKAFEDIETVERVVEGEG